MIAPEIVPGTPLVQSANFTIEIFGKGEYQPPKNKITPRMLTKSIIPYSDKNNRAQRIPEYSV